MSIYQDNLIAITGLKVGQQVYKYDDKWFVATKEVLTVPVEGHDRTLMFHELTFDGSRLLANLAYSVEVV